MKINSTLLLVFAVSSMAMAQKFGQKPTNNPMAIGHFIPKNTGDAAENDHFSPNIPPSSSIFRAYEIVVGSTVYDLQANASDNNRLLNLGNGNLRACWTMSKNLGATGANLPSWLDRGTGYNSAIGGVWGAEPSVKLESKRSGFPSFAMTENGTEFIVSHATAVAPLTGYSLNLLSKTATATTWTEKIIPRNTPKGSLWARAAAGGNNLYVISVTTPTGTTTNGVEYEGMNGKVLFSRSKDGGATFDKVDFSIPGLDSVQWKSIGGESYVIDAQDNYVAIGIFNWLNDVIVFKSADGGDTWTKLTVYNFPIENYIYDTGYLLEDIDTLDADRPTQGAVITSDDHGALRLDALGKVHCAFGAYYINDSIGGSADFSWFPISLGTIYWKEDFGEDLVSRDGVFPFIAVSNVQSLDGNNTWDVDIATEYNAYANTAPASMPSIGINNTDFTAYLATSVVDERFKSDNSVAYRHIYIHKIGGSGTTQDPLTVDGPLDVTEKAIADPILLQFTENAFPFLAKNCDDKVHVIYEADLVPGCGVTDMTTAANFVENTINYTCFNDNEVVLGSKVVEKPEISMKLMPNPAAEMLQIDLNFAKKTNQIQLLVFDMNGRQVFGQKMENVQNDRLFVPVSQLQNGIYSLTIRSEAGILSRKFSVLH